MDGSFNDDLGFNYYGGAEGGLYYAQEFRLSKVLSLLQSFPEEAQLRSLFTRTKKKIPAKSVISHYNRCIPLLYNLCLCGWWFSFWQETYLILALLQQSLAGGVIFGWQVA